MAQAKRVALALPPEVDLALTTLSRLLNQPKTSIITELLVDALPVINQVIKAVGEAKEGQMQKAIETSAKFVQDATHMLNQSNLDLAELRAKHGK